MFTADVLHPSSLRAADVVAWRAFRDATTAFKNPLLGPEFAQLVAHVREDARVAVFRRDGQAIGFLPFHKRANGFARPIGAPFSDYHALVCAPDAGIDGREALAAAGIRAIGFTALVDPFQAFPPPRDHYCPGYVIEMTPSAAAYSDAVRDANPKRYKNFKRLQNKLERELGPLQLTPGDTSEQAFAQLIAWKRDQYRRTGTHDVLRTAWARALFQTVFEQQGDAPITGVMTTLRAGGRLVAGHFGPRVGAGAHIWLSSMDPECNSCGPGLVMMFQAPQIMQALGLRAYDLGPGHDHYKAPFATRETPTAEGVLLAAGARGAAARAWDMAGRAHMSTVARVRRRLDHIAAVELSMGGRVRGVVDALAGYGRRSLTRRVQPGRAVQDETR